jgi:hypothetical protein
VKCGERVLLPKVRKTDPNTLIVSDGFSCRTQIAQGANRKAIHHAQVLQMAISQEQHIAQDRARPQRAGLALHNGNANGRPRASTVGMIKPGQAADHRSSSLKLITITAGSVAGTLLLAYVVGRYMDRVSVPKTLASPSVDRFRALWKSRSHNELSNGGKRISSVVNLAPALSDRMTRRSRSFALR